MRGVVYSVIDQSGGLKKVIPDVLKRREIGLPSELLLLGMIFMVIGRLFARLPFPDRAFRITFMSCCFGAATLALFSPETGSAAG